MEPQRFPSLYPIRACLILSVLVLSRRALARLRRAKDLVCLVEQAPSACSTKHTKSGERHRREQASVMECVVWTMRLAHGPHHTLHCLCDQVARERAKTLRTESSYST